MLSLGESAVVRTVSPNQTHAADIILIVDESSSMILEHDWIPDMTRQLDMALQVMVFNYCEYLIRTMYVCLSF